MNDENVGELADVVKELIRDPEGDETMNTQNELRTSLQFMWAQYKMSHLSNLIYSVSFIVFLLGYISKTEVISNAGDDGARLIIVSVFLAAIASGLAMIHRFTSQFFLEIEIFPNKNIVEQYYKDSGISDVKVSFSYDYPKWQANIFRYLHNVSKIFTSICLYVAWAIFLAVLVTSVLKEQEHNISNIFLNFIFRNSERIYNYWFLVLLLAVAAFSACYAYTRSCDRKKICVSMFFASILFTPFTLTYASTIQLPQTGQTVCYDAAYAPTACTNTTGQDANILAGKPLPNPRFTDNSNGTVTDNLTGLVWLKDAGCFSTVGGIAKGTTAATSTLTWPDALTWSSSLKGDNTACSLNDGSVAGDWRLPNITELESLVDFSQQSPALPAGHPFINVVPSGYYSSSSNGEGSRGDARLVGMDIGAMSSMNKINSYYVWPVRDVQYGGSP